MILTAVLLLIDDIDSPLVIAIAFVLVILPVIIFIAIILFLNKSNLKKIVLCVVSKEEPPSNSDVNNNETPMAKFDLVIDDSMRKNATVCVM